MYQGMKLFFILFLLFLLLSTTINKNKYIYSLLGALKVSRGNIGNKSTSIPCGSKGEVCYFLVTYTDFRCFSVTLLNNF